MPTLSNLKKIVVVDVDTVLANPRRRIYNSFLKAIGSESGLTDIGSYSQERLLSMLSEEQRKRYLDLFYSDRFLSLDEPILGAREVLLRCLQKGFTLAYLTSRHDDFYDSMKKGTLSWLEQHQFPVPDDETVLIFFKPQKELSNEEYRGKALREISSMGFILAGIGSHKEDAEHFLRNKANALILQPTQEKESYPKQTLFMHNWDDVSKWIDLNG